MSNLVLHYILVNMCTVLDKLVDLHPCPPTKNLFGNGGIRRGASLGS